MKEKYEYEGCLCQIIQGAIIAFLAIVLYEWLIR